jgi:hypothetical protein
MAEYRTTKWKGLDNFECASCPYATLDEEKIKIHVSAHAAGVPGPVTGLEEYEITHIGGGYYSLRSPDGELIEGPSNGKWQGQDGAIQGARAHRAYIAEQQEEEPTPEVPIQEEEE